MEKSNYSTLNKLILYTINRYIEQSIKEGLEPSPLHFKLKFATKVFMENNTLNEHDVEVLQYIANNEEFKDMLNIPISFLVFVLELVKIWSNEVPKSHRPLLNISDKKLNTGRSMFAMSMLKLKQTDADKHKEFSEIINDSVDVARKFFDFHVEKAV